MIEFMRVNMDLVEKDLDGKDDLLAKVKELRSNNLALVYVKGIESKNYSDFIMHGDIW